MTDPIFTYSGQIGVLGEGCLEVLKPNLWFIFNIDPFLRPLPFQMSIRAFRHICPGAIFAEWVTLFSSGMHYKYLFKILKQHATLLRIE